MLYVLRHAIAEDPHPGQADSDRQLTDKGRVKAHRLLSHAASIGVQPQTILSSPYDRAVQTASIAKEVLHYPSEIVQTPSLISSSSMFDLWESLRGYASTGDLMIVGHNPQLSYFVCWMLGTRGEAFWLKKSGLVALDVSANGVRPWASLQWYLTPGAIGS